MTQDEDPGYLVHELDTAVSALERRLLSPSGREELSAEVASIAEIDNRLYNLLYAIRPRVAA